MHVIDGTYTTFKYGNRTETIKNERSHVHELSAGRERKKRNTAAKEFYFELSRMISREFQNKKNHFSLLN